MSRLQHTRRRRWARASRRLVVVRRLLCRTAADGIASECEVARADVDVRRVCLAECWEEEFQGAVFSHARWRDGQVEDCAEVVRGDERGLCATEGVFGR